MASQWRRSPRITYIATDPSTVFRLMEGQLAHMREAGFSVTVVSSPGPKLDEAAAREGVDAVGIPMSREISPLRDLVSVVRLIRVLRRIDPDIVNAGTPKAGLLGLLAAAVCRVPVRIYLLRGLRFETAHGFRRLLLVVTEHAASAAAHRIFCNSESLRERFVSLGCAGIAKTWIPAGGSSNGIAVERYAVTPVRRTWASAERARLGIPARAIVVGFVGRFVNDKGFGDLIAAFRQAAQVDPRLHLLLVGSFDESDPVPASVRELVASMPAIHSTGFLDEPAPYFALMDILAFPSYREGLPNAPLEAAAAGVPVAAYAATGTVDAVLAGETGLLVPIGDIDGLVAAILRYSADPELMRKHGQNALHRVTKKFRREVVWAALQAEYERLLSVRSVQPS